MGLTRKGDKGYKGVEEGMTQERRNQAHDANFWSHEAIRGIEWADRHISKENVKRVIELYEKYKVEYPEFFESLGDTHINYIYNVLNSD